MNHWRRLERIYESAPCNAYYRPTIRIGDGTAEITIPIRPELHHAAGAAHGAVYFKAVDDAGFFAANSTVEDVFLLTVQLNVYLTRPIVDGAITAKGRLVTRTKTLFTAETVLTDSSGEEIGRGTGLYVRGKNPIPADRV